MASRIVIMVAETTCDACPNKAGSCFSNSKGGTGTGNRPAILKPAFAVIGLYPRVSAKTEKS